MNYIDFYFNKDNKFVATITEGKSHRTVSNYKNLKKLLKICSKYGYDIDEECYIEDDVNVIINEYERWYNSRSKYDIQVVGNIKPNMKVNRKNNSIKKKLTAASIAVLISICGISVLQKQASGINNPTTQVEINTNKETNTTKEETSKETTKETNKATTKKHDETTSKKTIKKDNKELKSMLKEEKAFNYSYEDRTNSENISNVKRYEDTFSKYANAYGLDKDLLMAIAAQESCGDHYNNLSPNQPGKGIMQIEYVHIGENLSAHNFETNTEDSIKVDMNTLSDLDSNIKIGAMILRNCIDSYNNNIPLAVQAYNFGPGNINKTLATCSELEHIDFNELKNDPTNNKWLDYRSFLNTGDPEYVEHVFSFIKNKNISILDKNNNKINITLENNIEKSKQL